MKKYSLMAAVWVIGMSVHAAGFKNPPQYVLPDTAPLVPYELAAQVGWEVNWQMNLPVKTNEQIARLGVAGENLFVMTDSNVMFCIDRAQGRLRFTTPLSARNLPVQPPLYYDEKFWFIVGTELLVFDPAVGDFISRKKIERINGAGANSLALNDTHLFIAGSDNRIHAVNRDGYWQEFMASADNNAPIVSVLAAGSSAVFATQTGNIVGMRADGPQKLWQFDATGPIDVPLVRDGAYIYAGSRDCKLYKIDMATGRLAWTAPYPSGAPIQKPFTVGRKIVYLYNALNGLAGVSKETGKAVWTAPAGVDVVCETPDKGFIFAQPGVLKVVDNNTGRDLYSVNFAQVQRWAVNMTDAVIYAGDVQGRLMSITVR
ncbi:MAG: PQQ-binding-like beta-propeller repeat protein [Phycisphaerae bacterium]|nr:PQQ-binding-like beta-propeller repeat protein [Phycisphaerae bacterium]